MDNVLCSSILKKDLDSEQLAAVEAPLTNTCVFAIAGSGKTRVLTYRVANLIDNGIDESSILLLTFTNKAADEMTERIKKLLNKSKLDLVSGTFHSVASMFVRKYADALDYSQNFDILDARAQKFLLKNCRDNYVKNFEVRDMDFPSHTVLADIYSGAINHNLTFVDYLAKFYPYIKGVTIDGILLIFEDYVARKEETNCLDFDDLMLGFYDLLKIEKIKEEITNDLKYIFVDEYQDINWLQYEILEMLNVNESMFVIGDSNQCIYQFRGSNDKYIDMFESSHKDVNRYYLTYNYRSTPEILKFAECSINNNKLKTRVLLNTKNKSNKKPFILGATTKEEQIEAVVDHIISHHGKELRKVAVLVRKGTEIQGLREELRKRGLSFKIKGGNDLLSSRYFNDLYNILSLIENPANEVAFEYTMSLFGVNSQTISKSYKYLKSIKYDMSKYQMTAGEEIKSIISMIVSFIETPYKNAAEKISDVYNVFYRRYVYANFVRAQEIDEEIQYLINTGYKFNTVSEFLDYYLLEKNKTESNNKNSLNIITMHKAKGLEWDYVYIINLNKTEFPRSKEEDTYNNTEQVQNERKLFYVSITRAKKELMISYSMKNEQKKELGPSVFLEEMDPDCFDNDFV